MNLNNLDMENWEIPIFKQHISLCITLDELSVVTLLRPCIAMEITMHWKRVYDIILTQFKDKNFLEKANRYGKHKSIERIGDKYEESQSPRLIQPGIIIVQLLNHNLFNRTVNSIRQRIIRTATITHLIGPMLSHLH